MSLPIGPPGREPLSSGARELDEELQEDMLERVAEEGARREEQRKEAVRARGGGFLRWLFRRPRG
jgi:hypothetical protein